jgi:hypothetical protein
MTTAFQARAKARSAYSLDDPGMRHFFKDAFISMDCAVKPANDETG